MGSCGTVWGLLGFLPPQTSKGLALTLWLYRINAEGARTLFDWRGLTGDLLGDVALPVGAGLKIRAGDLLLVWVDSASNSPLAHPGIVAIGLVNSEPYQSHGLISANPRDARGYVVNVNIRVDMSDDPIPESDLLSDERFTSARGYRPITALTEDQWSAVLDRCPIEILVQIERSLSPGTLAAAGQQSHATYQVMGGRELQSAINQRFSEISSARLSGIRFKSLSVGRWRQFADVSIEFSDRLTVITGANGAGKTSILHLLSPHFNWNNLFVSSPRRVSGGGLVYRSGKAEPGDSGPQQAATARLSYTNGTEAQMHVPDEVGVNFNVGWQNQQEVSGLYIPSHRAIAGYSSVPQMPTSFSTGSVLLEQFLGEVRSRYMGSSTGKTAGQWMKESLLASAYHGAGSGSADVEIEVNNDAREVWQGFQIVLRRLLPESLRFRRLIVRAPEIVIVTESDEFPLDAASGGISALMELGWQIFLRSREHSAFTVIFDEPENHLHPELQRSILPRLLEAFPNVSFVVATHSPFIVTSVPGAYVYALDYGERGVISYRVDPARGVKSAEEVLRRILGVGSTLPMWVDSALEQILASYKDRAMTPELFRELRGRLDEIGLLEEFPATAAALSERQADA